MKNLPDNTSLIQVLIFYQEVQEVGYSLYKERQRQVEEVLERSDNIKHDATSDYYRHNLTNKGVKDVYQCKSLIECVVLLSKVLVLLVFVVALVVILQSLLKISIIVYCLLGFNCLTILLFLLFLFFQILHCFPANCYIFFQCFLFPYTWICCT